MTYVNIETLIVKLFGKTKSCMILHNDIPTFQNWESGSTSKNMSCTTSIYHYMSYNNIHKL